MSDCVLIIDDDEEMCAELKEILTDEGYEVRLASDGHQGKEILIKGSYDAVILDLKLPGLNGYQVLKSAREHGCRAKIIVLSGRPLGPTPLNDLQDPAQAEEEKILSQADLVMNKPVDVAALLEKVRIKK